MVVVGGFVLTWPVLHWAVLQKFGAAGTSPVVQKSAEVGLAVLSMACLCICGKVGRRRCRRSAPEEELVEEPELDFEVADIADKVRFFKEGIDFGVGPMRLNGEMLEMPSLPRMFNVVAVGNMAVSNEGKNVELRPIVPCVQQFSMEFHRDAEARQWAKNLKAASAEIKAAEHIRIWQLRTMVQDQKALIQTLTVRYNKQKRRDMLDRYEEKRNPTRRRDREKRKPQKPKKPHKKEEGGHHHSLLSFLHTHAEEQPHKKEEGGHHHSLLSFLHPHAEEQPHKKEEGGHHHSLLSFLHTHKEEQADNLRTSGSREDASPNSSDGYTLNTLQSSGEDLNLTEPEGQIHPEERTPRVRGRRTSISGFALPSALSVNSSVRGFSPEPPKEPTLTQQLESFSPIMGSMSESSSRVMGSMSESSSRNLLPTVDEASSSLQASSSPLRSGSPTLKERLDMIALKANTQGMVSQGVDQPQDTNSVQSFSRTNLSPALDRFQSQMESSRKASKASTSQMESSRKASKVSRSETEDTGSLHFLSKQISSTLDKLQSPGASSLSQFVSQFDDKSSLQSFSRRSSKPVSESFRGLSPTSDFTADSRPSSTPMSERFRDITDTRLSSPSPQRFRDISDTKSISNSSQISERFSFLDSKRVGSSSPISDGLRLIGSAKDRTSDSPQSLASFKQSMSGSSYTSYSRSPMVEKWQTSLGLEKPSSEGQDSLMGSKRSVSSMLEQLQTPISQSSPVSDDEFGSNLSSISVRHSNKSLDRGARKDRSLSRNNRAADPSMDSLTGWIASRKKTAL